MKPADAMNRVVAELATVDAHLSGDDSPLANSWEEIKEQLQNGLSPDWPAYLATIKQFIAGFVVALAEDDSAELSVALKCSSREALERKLLQRLLARGKKEKVEYVPFEFEYFCYPLLGFVVYGRVIERTGLDRCDAQVFSAAAPFGEYGTVECAQIEHTLSSEQFEEVKQLNWPDKVPTHWST